MKVTRTRIPDVVLIELKVFADDRGHFFESFNHERFRELIDGQVSFVQDNQSLSRKGVIRGLHYQLAPKAQGKLVRVLEGEIFDVAVDIRKDSPTFGQWIGEIISETNNRQLWIPAGFAHGFQALSDRAVVQYKVTDYWSAAHERSLRWNDDLIDIKWPLDTLPIMSEKDRVAPTLAEIGTFE